MHKAHNVNVPEVVQGLGCLHEKNTNLPLPPPSCFSPLSNTVPLDQVFTGGLGSIVVSRETNNVFWSRDISVLILCSNNLLKHFVARQFIWLFQNGKDYIGNVSEISKPYKEKKRRNCAAVRAEIDSSLFFREEHRWNCK